jgi:hypothetical protein
MSSITSTKRTTVAAAGLALAAFVGAAAPALGATSTFADDRGDVAHGVDVESVKVVNEKNVRVRIQHDDLRKSFRSGASMTVYLDTDATEPGPEFAFPTVLFSGGDYGLIPTRGDGWSYGRRAVPLTCSYEANLDFARDVSSIRIARGCLDRPDEVRVAVKAAGTQADGDIVTDWLGGRRHLTDWVAKG